MFGNNLFYPGQQLFINPRGLGADLLGDPTKRGKDQYANLMGLGGYHVIKTVSNTIDSNGFSTSLDAIFTTSGDGVGTNARKGSQVGDEYLEICNTIQEAIQRFENGGTS